jgi:hypothetical protein
MPFCSRPRDADWRLGVAAAIGRPLRTETAAASGRKDHREGCPLHWRLDGFLLTSSSGTQAVACMNALPPPRRDGNDKTRSS